MSDAIGRAAARQRVASDPAASAFVSASAGSGKTKLLIDRLLRLMLPAPGRAATPPERILCLTFTKAGAAEMAMRLRRKLADWVLLDDAALDAELAALGLLGDPSLRAAGRALFARVLDMPGGLRIGTIHAFCESLLRRFPLEAAISPHFRLVEDTDSAAALDAARELSIGPAPARAVAFLAAWLSARDHAQLTARLQLAAERLVHIHTLAPDAQRKALRAALAVAAEDERALDAALYTGMDRAALRRAFGMVAGQGSAKAAEKAAEALLVLDGDAAGFDPAAWFARFVTGAGTPRQIFDARSALAKAMPELADIFRAESERLIAIEGERRALGIVEATCALLALSAPSLAAYAAHKDALGLVDFDDLIGRTRRLLDDPGVAWVLFKLDGGLDHLLLDEVQDTSADQWQIAGKLTEEFFVGAGGNPAPRTIFAVGDVKQSIYAFQGADPDGFRAWRETFRTRAEGAGAVFREPELDVSFRSSPAILRFVDAVFAQGPARDGVVEPGATLRHVSARPALGGRIELWPLAAKPQASDDAGPWEASGGRGGESAGPERLAEALADHLAALVRGAELRPGDILVLFRRRLAFAQLLMRALKARDVPVAGLDRMVLTDQLPVQDMLAFCDALLLPDDDLAFATWLVSPLGGLDDDEVMALALGRRGSLREALAARADEHPAWAAAHAFFEARFRRADYASPHALLAEMLGEGGGRARFLARFGPEAGEALDELLAASLTHAASHVPALQGFLHWLRRSGAEVKREAAGEEMSGPGEIRLMTVHGSKGLEANLVVLADTTGLPLDRAGLLWTEGDTAPALPLWVPGKGFHNDRIAALRETERRRALAEHNRLLYVALTRARERLLICGWEARPAPDCWYELCRAGFASIPEAERMPFAPAIAAPGGWTGEHMVLDTGAGSLAAFPGRPRPAPADMSEPRPAWLGEAPAWRASPPPAERVPRRSLTPSRPEGVEYGPAPGAMSPRARAGRRAARLRGEVLHALLQRIPTLGPDQAYRYASLRLDEAEAAEVAAQARAVAADARLARVFGPGGRAEQRIAGLVGDIAVAGVVDRMAIDDDLIELVDFKSGRLPPDDVAHTPVAYLRQMAAYRAVLQALRPGLPVACRLVWTAGPLVVDLPASLLDAHAPGSQSPKTVA